MPDYAIVAGVGRDCQSDDLHGHQRVLCQPACLSTVLRRALLAEGWVEGEGEQVGETREDSVSARTKDGRG